MIYVCILLGIISVCFMLKFFNLKRELRKITGQLGAVRVGNDEGRPGENAGYPEYPVMEEKKRVYAAPLKSREDNAFPGDYLQRKVTIENFDGDICRLATAVNNLIEEIYGINEKYLSDADELHRIISGISHDFRTPLTSSLGYLQMLEKEPGLSADALEYIKIIKEKNLLLKEFSDDFFEVTKLSNREFEIDLESVNISRIVSESIIRQADRLEEKGIACEFDVEEGVFCRCNAVYFERMMENLMTNVSKYAKSGLKVSLAAGKTETEEREQISSSAEKTEEAIGEQIGLATESTGTTQDGTNNSFSLIMQNDTDLMFEDNGELQKIFTPFFRNDSRSGTGTGLGLYVVKLLAEKMEMQVRAKIERTEGRTCFIIMLQGIPSLFD